MEVGFDARNLSMVSLDPVRDGYSGPQAAAFLQKTLDRLRALPYVSAATLADTAPMQMMGRPMAPYAISGAERRVLQARRTVVGRDFFATAGIPVLLGRGFRPEDETDESIAAVVNERVALDCGAGRSILGARLEIGAEGVPGFSVRGNNPRKALANPPRLSGNTRVVQVVGVVRNTPRRPGYRGQAVAPRSSTCRCARRNWRTRRSTA